jgi:hypothetical protein
MTVRASLSHVPGTRKSDWNESGPHKAMPICKPFYVFNLDVAERVGFGPVHMPTFRPKLCTLERGRFGRVTAL